MMAEYTKGPWNVEADSLKGDGHVAISGEGWEEFATVVIRMKNKRRDEPEGLANARLIAAAPQLLWALEQVDTYLSPMDWEEDVYAEIRGVIHDAIAKATGVSA
jgi:hypothetical protein